MSLYLDCCGKICKCLGYYTVFVEKQDKSCHPLKNFERKINKKSDVHLLLTIRTVQSVFFAGLTDYSAFVIVITTPYFIAVPDVCQIAAQDG